MAESELVERFQMCEILLGVCKNDKIILVLVCDTSVKRGKVQMQSNKFNFIESALSGKENAGISLLSFVEIWHFARLTLILSAKKKSYARLCSFTCTYTI